MTPNRYPLGAASAILSASLLLGCSGPTPVKAPHIDAAKAADEAVATYDKNGDGLLDAEELEACPALADAMKNNIDRDGDHKLSKEELIERLTKWETGGVGASFFTCRVMKGGSPLVGAEVTMQPVSFLEGAIQPAKGTTNNTGSASMAIDSTNLPSDLQNLRAVQQGMYSVTITHPSVSIPAEYNSDTKLGVEVSFDTGRNLVTFKL